MAFTTHCHEYFPVTPDKLVWTHIANQGRSGGQGDKLKKMGVHAGWFDYIFIAHPSPWKAIKLEAKVVDEDTGKKRDYSETQKNFDYFTKGMPIFKAKFYSVEEGHAKLIEAGIQPIKKCTAFFEPSYITLQQKYKMAFNMYKP